MAPRRSNRPDQVTPADAVAPDQVTPDAPADAVAPAPDAPAILTTADDLVGALVYLVACHQDATPAQLAPMVAPHLPPDQDTRTALVESVIAPLAQGGHLVALAAVTTGAQLAASAAPRTRATRSAPVDPRAAVRRYLGTRAALVALADALPRPDGVTTDDLMAVQRLVSWASDAPPAPDGALVALPDGIDQDQGHAFLVALGALSRPAHRTAHRTAQGTARTASGGTATRAAGSWVWGTLGQVYRADAGMYRGCVAQVVAGAPGGHGASGLALNVYAADGTHLGIANTPSGAARLVLAHLGRGGATASVRGPMVWGAPIDADDPRHLDQPGIGDNGLPTGAPTS